MCVLFYSINIHNVNKIMKIYCFYCVILNKNHDIIIYSCGLHFSLKNYELVFLFCNLPVKQDYFDDSFLSKANFEKYSIIKSLGLILHENFANKCLLLTVCICTSDGPVPTAVWSQALPMTACCLSPLPGFESWLGHVRKLPVTWG